MLWQNRAWIIDNLETQIKNQWTMDARQAVTQAMMANRGETLDENLERCAFKDQANKPIYDYPVYSKQMDIETKSLQNYGYWELVKKIVRVVFPETRDRAAEKNMKIYITGSGQGGTWAALSSMW